MQEKATISLEVKTLLNEDAMEHICPQKEQFWSIIYIVKKIDGGSRPEINLM